MFKKTIFALAVLGLASNASALTINASTTDTAAVVVQTPAISAVATLDKYAATAFFIHLDAAYSDGNTIAVTYSGATVDEDYIFSTADIPLVATAGGAVCGANQRASFAGFNAATQTVTYVIDSNAATQGCNIAIPVIDADGASLSTEDTFSVSAVGSTSFGQLEAAAAVKLIDVAVDNISQTIVTPLDETVDVENGRFQFVGAAGGDLTDVVTINTTEGANGDGAADILGATHVLTGDFSWTKKTDALGVVSRAGVAVTNSTNLVVTDTQVSWTSGVGTVANQVTLTPQTGTDKTILPATTFSLATTYTYDNGTDATVLNGSFAGAAGAWSLNGANITAYGIPNSTAVAPFLWVQNKGASTGDISVDVTCDGASVPTIAAGTAAASANTSIGAVVQAGVDAAGTCAAGSRYDAVVTVNGPEGDITLLAGYKVTAADGATDRISLETSDSLN